MRHFFLIFLLLPLFSFGDDLIEVVRFHPSILIDFRYATPDNSFGQILYPNSTIFLSRFVAHRLDRVREDLRKEGLGLILYEGYRPPSVQQQMERICPARKEEAPHYRKGVGVDVAIYYLDGQSLELPTAYDVVSPRAYRDHCFLGCHVYHNSALLERIMERYGFVPMREKWWHFDFRGYEDAPDLQAEYVELIENPAPRAE